MCDRDKDVMGVYVWGDMKGCMGLCDGENED